MSDLTLSDIEIAPPSVVRQAVRDFAATLVETPQFQAFEQASEALRRDENAQRAMQAYQAKEQSLQALLMLSAVGVEEQAELERLRQANGGATQADLERLRALQREVQSNRVIMDYAETQQAAIAHLPQINREISQLIGVDFASLAGPASC